MDHPITIVPHFNHQYIEAQKSLLDLVKKSQFYFISGHTTNFHTEESKNIS